MKTTFKITILLALFLVNSSNLLAQEIKGFVYELTSSNPIPHVNIKNIRTNQAVVTNKDGSFRLEGKVNDYLEVSIAGYKKDTIFYYEDAIRRIYLDRDESLITIDEVLVQRLTDSRLALEIEKAKTEGQAAEVSQQRGGLRISPSRLFGKKSKEARKNLDLLLTESNIRKVDRIFTTQLIASLTDMNPEEIALFRTRFRPSLAFVETASPEDLRVYILDSYKKFKEN